MYNRKLHIKDNCPSVLFQDKYQAIFIVTPCLNAAQTIDQTIQSVISQAGNFCICYHVQDGGSTDLTVERLLYWEGVLAKTNPYVQCRKVKFTWASEPDQGMYDAVVKGFDSMRIGPDNFMSWINGDDVLMPDSFSAVCRISAEYPEIKWIGGPTYVFDDDGPVLQRDSITPTAIIREGLCDGHHWYHLQQEGMFFKKVLWFKGKYAVRGFRLAGDWNLWRVFAQHAEYFQFVKPLGAFRRRKGQMSIDRMADYNAEIDSIISEKSRRHAFSRLFEKKDLYRNLVVLENPSGKFIIKKDIRETRKHLDFHWKNVQKLKSCRKFNKILFLGFSATAQKSGYFDKIKEMFSSKYADTIKLTRVGLGGLQPYHVRYLFPPLIRESSADLIVLVIAASAFRKDSQFYSAEDHLMTMLSLIAVSRQQGCSVAVIDFFRDDVDYDDDWVSKLHHAICSKMDVPYLNIAEEIYREAALREGLRSDGVHTNQKGSDYYGTRISEYLFSLMDNNSDRQNFVNRQDLSLFATAFDSIPCTSLVTTPNQYATFFFERTGYAATLIEIAEGQSIELQLPEIKTVCGFSYLMHPLSGYVKYIIDGVHIEKFLTYDAHSYYPRIGAAVFAPSNARKIVFSQMEGLPPVKLLKGEVNDGPRIGRLGRVFVQKHDKQRLQECVRELRF